MYEERKYREWVNNKDLVNFQVIVKESNLFIRANKDLSKEAETSLRKYRAEIEDYIAEYPEFLTTLKPYRVNGNTSSIIKEMNKAAEKAGVGPMASVAGVLAEYVGCDLLNRCEEIIVENGGDIFIKSKKLRKLGIYSGEASPFNHRIALEVDKEQTPLGISTSSGTIGHSLSFGKADVALVMAKSAALSDAWATAIGNLVKVPSDIQKAIDIAKKISEIRGLLVIVGKDIGAWGEIRLVKI